MSYPAHRPRRAAFSALLVSCSFLLASLAFAADAKKEFHIAADSPAAMLKQFTAQSGEQLLYSVESLADVKLTPVQGQLTSREALEQMVAGTNLRVAVDRKNGALSLVRATSPNAPSRRAEALAAQETRAKTKDGALQLEAYEVTGSRLRRDPATVGADPVLVYSRADIERTGSISIADFTNRLTQNSNELGGLTAGTTTAPLGARTTVNLRGLGNGTTLILINGRRMPRSGQGFNQDDYDINGIPIAAVERVEVLTDGASAVYGADAIGGVINIITRKNFHGTEATLQYGNTFHTDAAERAVSVSTGFSGEKYHGFLTASVSDRNSYGNDARAYTATANWAPSGGRDDRYGAYGGAGQVQTLDGSPLPGLTSDRAGIPNGQDGRNLTAAAFLPYDGVVEKLDHAAYADSVFETRLQSVRGNFSYEISPRVNLYFDGAYSIDRNYLVGAPPMASVIVPASNPFNPFGVDLYVTKTFYELGRSVTAYESRNANFTGGLRGELAGTWRYDTAYSFARQVSDNWAPLPSSIGSATADPLLALTSRAAALNVFGDGRTSPGNNPGVLESALGRADYKGTTQLATADLKIDGTLWRLPMGDLRVALGGEYREEKTEFLDVNDTDTAFQQLAKGADREVVSGFSEVLLPVVNPAWQLPLLSAFDLQFAGRVDRYPRFGEQFSPKISARWKPFASLTVRASVGSGFKTPTLYQLEQPVTTRTGRVTPARPPIDRARNETLTRNVLIKNGGNIDLLPEQSDSESLGVIYEPAFAKGLSLSADYYHIDFQDRVVFFVNSQDILDYFPDRITRGAPTPADVAAGRPGAITGVDLRAVNLARSEAEGIDFRLAFDHRTAAGRWQFTAEATRILSFVDQAAPGSPRLERADTPTHPKWRANTSLFWSRGAYEAGVNWHYVASTGQSPSVAAPPLPKRIGSASEFDVQFSYDFGRGTADAARRWASLLRGVKLTVGIRNVFDTEPPRTNGDGGFARLDPRQRRYQLSLRKTF